MSERPNTNWNLLDDDGHLSNAWATAYMMQQLVIAVVNLGEELRKIRRDMPLNDAARAAREDQDAAEKAEEEKAERAAKAWRHTAGIGAQWLRGSMVRAARQGEDVCSEAVAREMVESHSCTERQQASVLAWWRRKYPNTAPPVTKLRQKPERIKNDARDSNPNQST